MEVVVPKAEFHFDSSSTSPYVSAPSSPKPLGNPFDYYYHYTSAPTSPSRAAAIYATVDDWESIKSPKSPREFDFSFGFGHEVERRVSSAELTDADELFDKGRIRPMKPPPHPERDGGSKLWSPRGRKKGGGGKREELDSSIKESREATKERGRERALPPASLSIASSPRRSRRGARSLSPAREGIFQNTTIPSPLPSTTTSTTSSSAKSRSRKWRLKDLLLFRSASEGRATGRGSKDPLRKYTILSSSPSSSLPPPSPNKTKLGSNEGSGSIKRVSAHEMHYTANRAAAEELKKKTPLPYHRNALFSCLQFNPAVRSITKGFGNSFSRGGS